MTDIEDDTCNMSYDMSYDMSEANWRQPIKWNKNHEVFFKEHGRRQRVFCASMADVFDNEADPQWRADLLALIVNTPNLDWLLLTKRIGNARSMLDAAARDITYGNGRWGEPLIRNLWLGATICNQTEADRDIPKLLNVPATKRFLSIEPMLGPISLEAACDKAEMKLFKKNDGSIHAWYGPDYDQLVLMREMRDEMIDINQSRSRVGKKAAGRLLDGYEYNDIPT